MCPFDERGPAGVFLERSKAQASGASRAMTERNAPPACNRVWLSAARRKTPVYSISGGAGADAADALHGEPDSR